MDINNILAKSDDKLFNYCVQRIISGIDKSCPHQDNTIHWVLLSIMAGSEPFKVLLRENIGILSLSIHRVIAASILYFIYAALIAIVILTKGIEEPSLPDMWTSNTALTAVVCFYGLLGVIVLIRGANEHNKAKKNENTTSKDDVHRGNSFFIGIVDKPEQLWSLKEPLTCLIISLLIAAINPFMGFPLVLTSICFWVNEWYQVNNVWGVVDRKVQNAQAQKAFPLYPVQGNKEKPTVKPNYKD